MNSMRNRKLRRQGNVHVRRQLQGNTDLHNQPGEGRSEPRLPNERDESADSMVQAPGTRDFTLQAAADLNEGKGDTSMKPVMERTAADMQAAPSPAGAPAPVSAPVSAAPEPPTNPSTGGARPG